MYLDLGFFSSPKVACLPLIKHSLVKSDHTKEAFDWWKITSLILVDHHEPSYVLLEFPLLACVAFFPTLSVATPIFK